MKKDRLYDFFTLILKEMINLIGEPEENKEKEEPNPREQLLEMYEGHKKEAEHSTEQKAEKATKVMEVYKEKPLDANMILQKMEAITREREMIEKSKEAINKDRAKLESQQATLESAFSEAKEKGII